jgi:adenine deaminase
MNPSLRARDALTTVPDLAALERRVRVALGKEPGDLLLRGGQVVNVFTRTVGPANVVLADGWIAGVSAHEWPAREVIDLHGRAVLPGLIDTHMHLESTLLVPAELARLIVPHGTTAIVSDSHEIGNVLGIPGIELLLEAGKGLAFDLFFTASSCVPATAWEDAGATLGPQEVGELLSRPRVVGVAEMMDVAAVLAGDRIALEKIRTALVLGRVIDGHAPGLTGLDLGAYIATGIRSDHESSTVAEARAKAALGMLVQVREGSMAQNLDALLPLLARGELGDDWCLVTDDILADDIRRKGHIDTLLRRVVAGGVAAADAVRHATLAPARHYGLRDRGAVAPGYRADLVVVDDLVSFQPRLVLKNGQVVARDGSCVHGGPTARVAAPNTIHLPSLDPSAFELPLTRETVRTIRVIPGQILTRRETTAVRRQEGRWVFDPARDVLLIASIERHRGSGRIGLGLVSGFGFRQHGALASSVAHDSHNVIVAGSNPRDMLAAVRALAECAGGFVVVSDGEVRARLPLPVAGLLSMEPAEVVCRQLAEVREAARALGCSLPAPEGALSFLALPVIPEIRITTRGLFDVVTQQFVSPSLE